MSALLKLMFTTAAIATLTVSPSSAQNWFNADGTKTPGAVAITSRGPPAVGSVPFRDLSGPNYESRTVITSPFGTSISTYRSYSR